MDLRQHHAKPKVGAEAFDEQLDRLRDFPAWADVLHDEDRDAIRELLNRYHEVIAIARDLVAEGDLAARAILVTDERRP